MRNWQQKILKHLHWWIGGSFVLVLIMFASAFFSPAPDLASQLPEDTVLVLEINKNSAERNALAPFLEGTPLPELFTILPAKLMLVILDEPWAFGILGVAKGPKELLPLFDWQETWGMRGAPLGRNIIAMASDQTTLARLQQTSPQKDFKNRVGQIAKKDEMIKVRFRNDKAPSVKPLLEPREDTIFFFSDKTEALYQRMLPLLKEIMPQVSWNELFDEEVLKKIGGDISLRVDPKSFLVAWKPGNPEKMPQLTAIAAEIQKTMAAHLKPRSVPVLLPDETLAHELRLGNPALPWESLQTNGMLVIGTPKDVQAFESPEKPFEHNCKEKGELVLIADFPNLPIIHSFLSALPKIIGIQTGREFVVCGE